MQIVNQTASEIALTVIGHASQSTNILSIRSNSASSYLHVDATGNVFVGSPLSVGQNTGGLTIGGKDIELMQIMGAY
jgi:hypothetical protein